MGSEETIVHNTFGRLENKTLLATKLCYIDFDRSSSCSILIYKVKGLLDSIVS